MVFLKPTYMVDGDVTDLDLEVLCRDGIRGLIFDLDSTLLAPHSGTLTPEVEQWLMKARSLFKLAIVSNNRREPYVEAVVKLLDIPAVGRAGKPSRRGFFKALEWFALSPPEVAVIGDRPLTDVWGGQRAGMKTVLVWPLKTMSEPSWISFFRKLERCFIRF